MEQALMVIIGFMGPLILILIVGMIILAFMERKERKLNQQQSDMNV